LRLTNSIGNAVVYMWSTLKPNSYVARLVEPGDPRRRLGPNTLTGISFKSTLGPSQSSRGNCHSLLPITHYDCRTCHVGGSANCCSLPATALCLAVLLSRSLARHTCVSNFRPMSRSGPNLHQVPRYPGILGTKLGAGLDSHVDNVAM